MADDVDRRATGIGDPFNHGDEVVEFALDRVRLVRTPVAGSAPPAAIDGVERVMSGQQRPAGPPRGVIGGRAVDEDDGRTRAGPEDRDGHAVRGDDDAIRGCVDRHRSRAASRSTIQVAPGRRASWAGSARTFRAPWRMSRRISGRLS